MKRLFILLLMCGSMALSGCSSLIAPKYSFSPENVQALKDGGTGKVRLGEFRAATPETESADIGMRGSHLNSPYGSYSAYLREAILQEFTEAGRYSADANTEIGGILEKNLFNANGISQGDGELAARITVQRDGVKTFDKQLSAKTTWPSSFAAMTAIPKAVTEYPKLVREFVRALSQDPDFINATK